jgi:hypothetical protein
MRPGEDATGWIAGCGTTAGAPELLAIAAGAEGEETAGAEGEETAGGIGLGGCGGNTADGGGGTISAIGVPTASVGGNHAA